MDRGWASSRMGLLPSRDWLALSHGCYAEDSGNAWKFESGDSGGLFDPDML